MKNQLIDAVIGHCGLPENLVQDELYSCSQKAGLEMENLSLDQLRDLMAEYLQDVFVELKQDLASKPTESISS